MKTNIIHDGETFTPFTLGITFESQFEVNNLVAVLDASKKTWDLATIVRINMIMTSIKDISKEM